MLQEYDEVFTVEQLKVDSSFLQISKFCTFQLAAETIEAPNSRHPVVRITTTTVFNCLFVDWLFKTDKLIKCKNMSFHLFVV